MMKFYVPYCKAQSGALSSGTVVLCDSHAAKERERRMHHFFAYIARMKHIRRWSLMRNTQEENVAEHTAQVTMIAHALALLQNSRFGGQLDVRRVLELSLYHDAGEVITGDLPTPVKYFTKELRTAYQEMESEAGARLLAMLPSDLKAAYEPLLCAREGDEEEWKLVKAADRLCAYVKCVEEMRGGNAEFERAKESVLRSIEALDMPAVDAFMREFAPSFALTLDELN